MKTRPSKLRIPPIIYIMFGLLGLLGYCHLKSLSENSALPPPLGSMSNLNDASSLNGRLSWGEHILLIDLNSSIKQQGISAFSRNDYSGAIQALQTYLVRTPNDPEARIYLNNAKAASQKSIKIAVVVPIGSNTNIAQEILRGVAQAQEEVNRQGGINGVWLQVQIVNDDNDPKLAEKLAKILVQNSDILAIVGHNSSNASLAAAPVYQKAGLVMISPTSFANRLSNYGSYIFRTVPNIRAMASPLAKYVLQSQKLQQIAVCYDSQSPDNTSFRDEFVAVYTQLGGQVTSTVCDFSHPNFNPTTTMAEIVAGRAQGVLLSPHVDRINRATTLVSANQQRLPLFATPTMYTIQTLQESGRNAEGLILSVPWFPAQPFAGKAQLLWGGPVNWRTANSYDATAMIIAGLKRQQTRSGLQQVLVSSGFTALGANGAVRFLPTGDRDGAGILVKVASSESGGPRFDLLSP